jgi:hypothetical protein
MADRAADAQLLDEMREAKAANREHSLRVIEESDLPLRARRGVFTATLGWLNAVKRIERHDSTVVDRTRSCWIVTVGSLDSDFTDKVWIIGPRGRAKQVRA